MAHKTIYNRNSGIIETSVHGDLGFDEIKTIVSDITVLAKKHNCILWLNNYSNAIPKLTYSQIYEVPNIINEAAEDLSVVPCKIKRAVVADIKKDKFTFVRTVSLNKGLTMELFDNNNDAQKWLSSSDDN